MLAAGDDRKDKCESESKLVTMARTQANERRVHGNLLGQDQRCLTVTAAGGAVVRLQGSSLNAQPASH